MPCPLLSSNLFVILSLIGVMPTDEFNFHNVRFQAKRMFI